MRSKLYKLQYTDTPPQHRKKNGGTYKTPVQTRPSCYDRSPFIRCTDAYHQKRIQRLSRNIFFFCTSEKSARQTDRQFANNPTKAKPEAPIDNPLSSPLTAGGMLLLPPPPLDSRASLGGGLYSPLPLPAPLAPPLPPRRADDPKELTVRWRLDRVMLTADAKNTNRLKCETTLYEHDLSRLGHHYIIISL